MEIRKMGLSVLGSIGVVFYDNRFVYFADREIFVSSANKFLTWDGSRE
jgi:hypothetical protein